MLGINYSLQIRDVEERVDLLKRETITDFIPPSLWPKNLKCDSVNAWTSVESPTKSDSGIDVFALIWQRKVVISKCTVQLLTKNVILHALQPSYDYFNRIERF